MDVLRDLFRRWWGIAAVIAGIGLLIGLEILEEPELTFSEILFELIEPTLIVLTAAGLIHLFGRMQLRGLGEAIDAQFDRWGLTPAEREVALLILKGLSHKEIAAVRESSERTARQQARAIYAKANLSGRAALSAFFLEDLLLPADQRG